MERSRTFYLSLNTEPGERALAPTKLALNFQETVSPTIRRMKRTETNKTTILRELSETECLGHITETALFLPPDPLLVAKEENWALSTYYGHSTREIRI